MIVCGVMKAVDIIIYYGIDLTSNLKTTNLLSLFEFHTAQIATAKLALKVQYWLTNGQFKNLIRLIKKKFLEIIVIFCLHQTIFSFKKRYI